MTRTTAAGLALGIAGIIGLAVPLTRTALASDSQPAATPAQSSTSAQPATTSAQPLPSWTSTGTYTYGPGTIAPDGAPDYIGNSPADCPAASGNQQQNASQQGGNRNGRHHRGQSAATSAQPLPSWTSTGTYTYGPGTIAPDGAPDYIGNSPAGCAAASGNQQQNASQQGGNRNGRHHRGQQPTPSPASPPPGTGS